MLWRYAVAVLVAVLAASCGDDSGSSTTPRAPAPGPAPPPAIPPPEPPTVEAIAWLYEQSAAEGYYAGERIRVVVEFDEPTTVEGSPRLAIQIGDHLRLADFSPWIEDDFPPSRPSFLQRFDYEVQADDEDEDGISIAADALDFSEGAFLNTAGAEIEVEITAIAPERDSPSPVGPGETLVAHRVLGHPEPRVCTDERRRALRYGNGPVPVREWDGTPFRVDMINSFPEGVTDEDVAGLLDAVRLLDAKIEDQLGYRIIEAGEVLPVPAGMRPGWNTDEQRHRAICPLPRKRGQIQGFYMDDTNHGSPGSDAQANGNCGDFNYNQPLVTVLGWPCRGCEDERTAYNHFFDGVTLHEIFHLFGFAHTEDTERLSAGRGVPMSWTLRRAGAPDAGSVLWPDIDLLRCIFPERG